MIGRAFLSDLANVSAFVDEADAVERDLFAEGKVAFESRHLVVEVGVAPQKNQTLEAVLVPLDGVLEKNHKRGCNCTVSLVMSLVM